MHRTFGTNLTGMLFTLCMPAATWALVGWGSILVTASPTGITGEEAGFTAYPASKAGIHGLARAVAAEYTGLAYASRRW